MYEEMDALKESWLSSYELMYEKTPLLSRGVKSKMFELHQTDPDTWNLPNLSMKFGLSTARVKAVLMLQKMRLEMERTGQFINDFTLQEEMEKYHGVVDRLNDKAHFTDLDPAGVTTDMPVPEDFDPIELKNFLEKQNRRKPPKEELPPEPAPEYKGPEEMVVMYEPPPTKPVASRGLIIIDMNDRKVFIGKRREKLDDRKRMMWITEPTGLVRTITWTERKRMLHYLRPPAPQRRNQRRAIAATRGYEIDRYNYRI